MKHGSLFSGIGGFDLAAEWVGWDNKFFCDFDPFCQTILKYHFPYATPYKDIKETDFTPWNGQIDVLSGGFPCQPFSQAGKRKGTSDERHLWPEMLRAIRQIRPRWVLGENVLGIVNWNAGLVFEQVCADLETEGYAVQPFVLPAAGVNAPHQRYRTWFIARIGSGSGERPAHDAGYSYGALQAEVGQVPDWTGTDTGGIGGDGMEWDTPYTEDERCERRADGRRQIHHQAQRPEVYIGAQGSGRECAATHTDINGSQTLRHDQRSEGKVYTGQTPEGYKYGRLSDYWSSFPSQSPVCGGDDGLSAMLDGISFPKWRRESIKAYGNAIVPQVAYRIFRAIDAMEQLGEC